MAAPMTAGDSNDGAPGHRPDGPCPWCGADDWRLVARFTAPPPGENDFSLSPYDRSLWQCGGCRHVVNAHGFDLDGLYGEAYWDRVYGGDRMEAMFHKVMALPAERSDNRGRARWIDQQVSGLRPDLRAGGAPSLLDVGSGLAVFPAVMREYGWQCTALDPDRRGADHARRLAGCDAVSADFRTLRMDRRFDLITFNKVLEHVADPVSMLARAADFLAAAGLVYVELPDGEGALAAGPEREEFMVEHYAAFSAASLQALIAKAGFRLLVQESLIEPSGKYTLRALACAADG